jgi:hypothetical protein
MITRSIGEAISALESNPDKVGTLKVPIEAGLLMRGTIRDWIKYAQGYDGIKVHAFERWGLIESAFSIEIEGEARRIAYVLKTLAFSVTA